jgi:hypothetical protein
MRRRVAGEAPSLVAERAAREEAANRAADAGRGHARPLEIATAASGELHRGGRGLLQGRRGVHAPGRGTVVSQQTGHDRLSRLDGRSEHGVGDGRRRRLGDDEQDPRLGVVAQGRDTPEAW